MMDEYLKQLAIARKDLKHIQSVKRKDLEEFLATPVQEQLSIYQEQEQATITQLEAMIRDMGLAVYTADQNKHPQGGGYEVKEFKVVMVLDEAQAREWCFQNFRPALKLDKPAFEKAAKDGNIPDQLAAVVVEPRVQIAGDLSKFMEQDVQETPSSHP